METAPLAGKSSPLSHKFPHSRRENQAPITVIKSVEKGKGKKEGKLINKPMHHNANAWKRPFAGSSHVPLFCAMLGCKPIKEYFVTYYTKALLTYIKEVYKDSKRIFISFKLIYKDSPMPLYRHGTWACKRPIDSSTCWKMLFIGHTLHRLQNHKEY